MKSLKGLGAEQEEQSIKLSLHWKYFILRIKNTAKYGAYDLEICELLHMKLLVDFIVTKH